MHFAVAYAVAPIKARRRVVGRGGIVPLLPLFRSVRVWVVGGYRCRRRPPHSTLALSAAAAEPSPPAAMVVGRSVALRRGSRGGSLCDQLLEPEILHLAHGIARQAVDEHELAR